MMSKHTSKDCIFILAVISLMLMSGCSRFQETGKTESSDFEKEALNPGINAEKFIAGNDNRVEQITIYGNKEVGKAKLMNGFLHGITYDPSKNYDKTIELLSALKPRFWRLSPETNNVYGFVVNEAQFPQKLGTLITFNIQGAFNTRYGYDIKVNENCPTEKSNCFKTFMDFQSAWNDTVNLVMKEKAARNLRFDYFEVFAEPTSQGGGGFLDVLSQEQLLTLYKDTNNIIRSYEPAAKIGGPSLIDYFPRLIEGFLDYIVAQNIRLDYIVWHEFHAPEDLVKHVEDVRKMVSARPALCNPSCPEIIIGEFSPPEHMHIPATGLAWFYYLEKAGVDGANRACWDVEDPSVKWDTCWASFNGMFLRDNVATTDMYWVYRMYADMDNMRLLSESSKNRTVAIVDKDDTKQEIKVLVSRYGYGNNEGDVKITVKDYPFQNSKVQVNIWKIPANGKMYHILALERPIAIEPQMLDVSDGEVSLSIGSFQDGEVYYFILKPA